VWIGIVLGVSTEKQFRLEVLDSTEDKVNPADGIPIYQLTVEGMAK
jgi:hypothetical protein